LSASLKKIHPHEIGRNPINPRLAFYDAPMETLRKSIEKVGVLVPITVYEIIPQKMPEGKTEIKYLLVDGERRWRCALDLGLPEVPAVIIPEPDQKTILLQMFSIHHLRVQWKLIWTALKLETLMHMMNTKDDDELSSYTGMSKRKIDHCKRILSYPKKYQDILLVPEKDERVTSDFFVELYPVLREIRSDIPIILETLSETRIIDSLITKFRNNKINAAREFRILKEALNRTRDRTISKEKIIDLFTKLITDPEMDIKQISGILLMDSSKLADLAKTCNSMAESLSEISKDLISNDRNFQKSLGKLEQQVSRLASEENQD
jgi:ParB family transcriptional regulator, chromosome partitioning protein